MIHLGIVGAESPMGKLVLQKIQEHKEKYRLCFKVDASYQNSYQNATFKDVDDALLALSPTLIFDFGEETTAYERGKLYQTYHIPAIMSMAGFDTEKIELLQTIRTAKGSSPTLVIEPSFSLNQALAVNQALQMLKLLASDIVKIKFMLGYNNYQNFDFAPFLKFVDNKKKIQCSKNTSNEFCIDIILQHSHISISSSIEADDLWRGMELLAEYVANNPTSRTPLLRDGLILSGILPNVVERFLL